MIRKLRAEVVRRQSPGFAECEIRIPNGHLIRYRIRRVMCVCVCVCVPPERPARKWSNHQCGGAISQWITLL